MNSPTRAGSWLLLLFFLICYAGAGALAVWAGRVAPGPVSLALTAPALPWVLWLFPASIPEAGLPRALLWPALALLMGGLGWLGGKAVTLAIARSAHQPLSVSPDGKQRGSRYVPHYHELIGRAHGAQAYCPG